MIKKILKNKYTPYIIFLLYLIVIHSFTYVAASDDITYAHVLDKMSVLDAVKYRYKTWASRAIIEAVFFKLLTLNPVIWKVLDVIMCMWIFYSLSKLIKVEGKIQYILLLLCIVYPASDMTSAGYIATTTNYIFPLAFLLYSFVILQKKLENRKVYIWEWFIAVICLLYGCNQEQYTPVVVATLILTFIYEIVSKKKINVLCLLMIIVSVAELIFILTCPGNGERLIEECKRFITNFAVLNLFDKLRLGLMETMNVFLCSTSNLFLIFSIVLAVCMYVKTKSFKRLTISLTPLIGILLFNYNNAFENTKYAKYLGDAVLTYKNFTSISVYWRYAIYIFICLIIILSFYLYFNSIKQASIVSWIFIMGIGARMILGFSPTLYVSGLRTFLITYVAIVVITTLIIKELTPSPK